MTPQFSYLFFFFFFLLGPSPPLPPLSAPFPFIPVGTVISLPSSYCLCVFCGGPPPPPPPMTVTVIPFFFDFLLESFNVSHGSPSFDAYFFFELTLFLTGNSWFLTGSWDRRFLPWQFLLGQVLIISFRFPSCVTMYHLRLDFCWRVFLFADLSLS